MKKIGTVYKNQGNYDSSIAYFLRCMKMVEKKKGKNHIESVHNLIEIANIY